MALDYDGTLAKDDHVDSATVKALWRWREAGGQLILVTGRRLEPLLEVFPQIDVFHFAVVENGALLYDPQTGEEQPLADPPPPALLEALYQRQVPCEVGRVIVATNVPHDRAVLEVIGEQGLDLSVIFNKRAVMVLPANVNKVTGLKAAFEKLTLSPQHAIGVGDAENDAEFITFCDISVAVANALPALKDIADIVTTGERGAGVVECIERFLNDFD